MSDDDTRSLIRAQVIMAMQGEKEGINAVADRLYDMARSAPVDDGRMSVTQQDFQNAVVIAGNDRAEFLAAADKFKRNYRELSERPDLWARTVAVESKIAQEHPELSYEQRMRRAGNVVRSWKDANEDGDERYNRVVVRGMKKSRGAAVLAEPDDEDITQIYESESAEPDDAESEYSFTIAQMKRDRRGGVAEELGD